MKKSINYSVLATACVTPPISTSEKGGVRRYLPEQRLDDYKNALSWWVTCDCDLLGDLVVLENSGFDGELLRKEIIDACSPTKKIRRNIEVLTCDSSPRPLGVHYGFSEFQMIDQLIDHSVLLGGRFVKTTGRYVYPKINALVSRAGADTIFSIDSKKRPRIPFVFDNPARSCKAGLFISERDFFNSEVRGLYKSMSPAERRTHVEDLIFDKLISRHGYDGISLRFPIECPPVGIGGNGQSLVTTRKRMESRVRSVQRMIFPGFWI